MTRKTQVIWLTVGAMVCVAAGMMAGKLTHGIATTAQAKEDAEKERQKIEIPAEPTEIIPEPMPTAPDLDSIPPADVPHSIPLVPHFANETITFELLPPPTPVADELLPPPVPVAIEPSPSGSAPLATGSTTPPPLPSPAAGQPIPQIEAVQAVPALVMFATRTRSHVAGQPIPLTGTFSCIFDEHRSLVLPAEMMKQLDDTERGLLFARPGPEQCLWIYTPTGLTHLADRLERQGASDAQARLSRRLNFARSEAIALDQCGKLTIPENLAKFAGLGKNLVVIGVADHLEVWDAQTWHKYLEPQDPVVPVTAP